MWPNSGAAGYYDPTTLFDESGTATSSSSSTTSTHSTKSDEDERALFELYTTAPALLTASAGTSPTKSNPFSTRKPKGSGRAELTDEERQLRREKQQRHFFQNRGAVDFQRSVVFEVVEPAKRRPCQRKGGSSRSTAEAEPEVWRRPDSCPSLLPSPPGAGTAEPTNNIACVPAELQAWYVAGNAAPSAAARDPPRRREDTTRTESSAVRAGNSKSAAAFDSGSVHADFSTPAVAAAAVEPAVRGSGAGTTSVNVLWGRTIPDAETRQGLRRASPAPSRASLAAKAKSRHDESERVKEEKRKKQRNEEASKDRSADSVTQLPPPPSPRSAAAAAASSSSPPSSSVFSSSSLGEENTGSTSQSTTEKNSRGSGSSDGNRLERQASPVPEGSVDSEFGRPDPTTTAMMMMTGDFAEGGRPPLRAHRYVEQPNGVFIDHAQHAELLAQYALEEQLRYAQEKEDLRRARRWNRLLHGSHGDASRNAANREGGVVGSGIVNSTIGGGGSSAGGAAYTHYHWMYDAATYRATYVSTLRYLQRVHVFVIGVAAGISLLTLIAMTTPFPELKRTGAEDGLPGDMSAVLLLAMINTSAAAAPSSTSLPVAQVLPVLQQGHTVLAVLIAVLQPYHASLFLLLCMLLLVTGYAPVPWGAAERLWAAQRRRWLFDDMLDRQQQQQQQQQQHHHHGEPGTPRHAGGYYARGQNRMSGSVSNYNCYSASPHDDDVDDDRSELSGSAGAYYGLRQRSPLSRTLNFGPHSPLRRSTLCGANHYSSGYSSSDDGQGYARKMTMTTTMMTFPPPPHHHQHHHHSTSLYKSNGSDPLWRSISLGRTRGEGGYADNYDVLGTSFSVPLSPQSPSQPQPQQQRHSAEQGKAKPSLGDLPSGSFVSFARQAYAAAGSSGKYSPNMGFLASTSNFNDLGFTAPNNRADPSLMLTSASAFFRTDGLGRVSAASNRRDGGGGGGTHPSSREGFGAPKTPHRRPFSFSSSSTAVPLQPPPPLLLLLPTTALEGRLSADNAYSRTFDYCERRATQWACDAIKFAWNGGRCCGRTNGRKGRKREGGSRRYAGLAVPAASAVVGGGGGGGGGGSGAGVSEAAASALPAAVPISLYLHVLLQPRLWCVVVALALTLVELAFLDERSVELMWLAQPASWWSAAPPATAVSGAPQPQQQPRRGALPHTWLTAVFYSTAGDVVTEGVHSTASVAYGNGSGNSFNDGGRVGRVLLGVYATRTAVIWIAFLLNLFF